MAQNKNYRVLRQFSGDRLFKVDEIVSLDGRNVQKLLDMRYLAETDSEVTTPERRGPGRPRKEPESV